ncbi:hypothetical protein Gorai_004610, partial [Gossypium raimondii]|nr:hypothetical protein [Gossypium raimondii]
IRDIVVKGNSLSVIKKVNLSFVDGSVIGEYTQDMKSEARMFKYCRFAYVPGKLISYLVEALDLDHYGAHVAGGKGNGRYLVEQNSFFLVFVVCKGERRFSQEKKEGWDVILVQGCMVTAKIEIRDG